jgi:hypothetical protein
VYTHARARVYAATTLSLHPVGKIRPPPPGSSPFYILSIPPSRGEWSASSSPPSDSLSLSLPLYPSLPWGMVRLLFSSLRVPLPLPSSLFLPPVGPSPSLSLPARGADRTIQRESTLERLDTCAPRTLAKFIESEVYFTKLGFRIVAERSPQERTTFFPARMLVYHDQFSKIRTKTT